MHNRLEWGPKWLQCSCRTMDFFHVVLCLHGSKILYVCLDIFVCFGNKSSSLYPCVFSSSRHSTLWDDQYALLFFKVSIWNYFLLNHCKKVSQET